MRSTELSPLNNRWLQRLRTQLWLKELMLFEGNDKTAYFLDRKFSTEEGLSSADRRKEFDYIIKTGKPPREDVRTRVKALYPTIEKLYQTPFWEILDAGTELGKFDKIIFDILSENKLERYDYNDIASAISQKDEYEAASAGFRLASNSIFQWHDSFSLFLALYLEARVISNNPIIEILEDEMDAILDLSINKYFPWTDAMGIYTELLRLSLLRPYLCQKTI